MQALVLRNGALRSERLPAPSSGSLKPAEVLCRTLAVDLGAVDRALISGALDVGSLGAPPEIADGGYILGQAALAEVVEVGAEVHGVEKGQLVSPALERPFTGHGFAQEMLVVPAQRLTAWQAEIEQVPLIDLRTPASSLPLLEQFANGHYTGTFAAMQRHQRLATPTQGLFRFGCGVSSDSFTPVPPPFHQRKALIVGSGPEVLFLAGILRTMTTGEEIPGKCIEVAVCPTNTSEDMLEALRRINVEVLSSVDAIDEESIDVVHVVNVSNRELITSCWARLSEFGALIWTDASPLHVGERFPEMVDEERRTFTEWTEVVEPHRGTTGPISFFMLNERHGSWWSDLPVDRFEGIDATNAQGITRAVQDHPWRRISVSVS